jgi:hypothetical protein
VSDDDSPDNVLQMPRIGSPPPPPVPPPPVLGDDAGTPDPQPDTVRISAFDAPAVPHAPQAPGSVPAALRSDGLDDTQQVSAVPPPRSSVLSVAAVLAIALAAFEGLQSWIQESGPRRAEAAKHQRELELLAAKAGADAARLGAEADKEHARSRRVPSSHDYGRSALGRGSGGSGRGGGIGPGRSGTGRTGPSSGLAQGRGTGSGSRGSGGPGRSGTGRNGSGPTGSGTGSGRNGASGNRNGGSPDRNGSPRGRNGASGGGRSGGFGSSGSSEGSGGIGTRGAGGPGSASGGSGRRSPRQALTDWWGKGKKSPDGSGGPNASGAGKGTKAPGGTGTKAAGGGTGSKAAGRGPVRGGPTFWDDLKNRVGGAGRVKPRRAMDGTPPNKGSGRPPTVGAAPGSSGTDGDRVHLKDAAWEAVNARWKKRRSRWTADDGSRRHRRKTDGERQAKEHRRKSAAGERKPTEDGRATGDNEAGQRWYDQPRSSPFDQAPQSPVVITVEQVDPPGAHAKRWEPTAIGPRQQALPKQSAPALPRAPQRPAGQRPGTSRRKEPIPMPPVPARTAGVPAPVTASVPAPGGMSAHHATDITLNDVLKALTLLTTEGMETHDDCAELARKGKQLLSKLESMAEDLAVHHNVTGARTLSAVSALMESVGQMVVQAKRMARAALAAAELSEAEETAMARDYRPTQAATADAGLVAPSARIHNEN